MKIFASSLAFLWIINHALSVGASAAMSTLAGGNQHRSKQWKAFTPSATRGGARLLQDATEPSVENEQEPSMESVSVDDGDDVQLPTSRSCITGESSCLSM